MANKGFTIKGLDDVQKVLESIAPKHAQNLARSTVQAVASEAAKVAKKRAPKDKRALKKAIKAKRRKSDPLKPQSSVIVEHGKGAKNDAWYWRFVEFGTQKQNANPFLLPTVNEFNARLPQIYTEKFANQLIKKLKREKKKARR